MTRKVTLDWLEANGTTPVAIITDSQSLCLALLGDGFELDILRSRLRSYAHRIIIQWVPGHQDIPGNELADVVAKEAAELRLEQYAPTWFHSAAARIKATRKDPAPSHPRIKAVYEFYSKEKEEEVQSRSDQSLLAKIRSGHSILFAAYRKRIDESEDDTCPSCQLEPQTMEHWMTSCQVVSKEEIFITTGLDRYRSSRSKRSHSLRVRF